jgi:predicted ribosome quality control (RQC) complex YloA/Tae2 family protein
VEKQGISLPNQEEKNVYFYINRRSPLTLEDESDEIHEIKKMVREVFLKQIQDQLKLHKPASEENVIQAGNREITWRRKKMNKHKYRKLRKRTRAERAKKKAIKRAKKASEEAKKLAEGRLNQRRKKEAIAKAENEALEQRLQEERKKLREEREAKRKLEEDEEFFSIED